MLPKSLFWVSKFILFLIFSIKFLFLEKIIIYGHPASVTNVRNYCKFKIKMNLANVKYLVVLNRAVDGNLAADYWQNSCTHTRAMKEGSPWLVVDLSDFYRITGVKILNRRDCCSE